MRISAYDFGRISIDGRMYGSDVILHAGEVIESWWRKEGHSLVPADLDVLWDDPPAVLVVGTGFHGRMEVPEATRAALAARGVEVRPAKTREAVSLFNALSAEKTRRVDAALHLTC